MKVLLTGASGFVGAHTAAALVADGHDVRALVRSGQRLERALMPLGIAVADVVEGDVTDPGSVRQALDGCDAAIHAANLFTYSTRFQREMEAVNVGGTELVLSQATALGLDPILYVSSYVTVLPSPGGVPADPPLGDARNQPYVDSKRGGEAIARRLQSEGLPVVTTYPGAVWGPHDPGKGQMVKLARFYLSSPTPLGLDGHLGIVDVAWLARLHSRLIERGKGPRRILAPGTMLSWREIGRQVFKAAGRSRPRYIPTPPLVATAAGRAAQFVSRRIGVDLTTNAEVPWLIKHWQPGDDHLARGLAGDPPPVEETIARAVEWMIEKGHIRGRTPVSHPT